MEPILNIFFKELEESIKIKSKSIYMVQRRVLFTVLNEKKTIVIIVFISQTEYTKFATNFVPFCKKETPTV